MGVFDLHCHLLPHVDDGLVREDMLSRVLTIYRECGYSGLAFTPHLFNPFVTTDVKRIRGAFETASSILSSLGMKGYLGSELFIRDQESLMGIPIAGRYQLLEFDTIAPAANWEPRIERLAKSGIVPLIAHVERYTWMTVDSESFKRLRALGALIQVNVEGVKDESALPYLEEGVVDVMATDHHGLDEMVPATLMETVQKWPDVLARMQALGL